MNIEAYNLIIDKIKPLLDGRGFKTVDTETGSYFENGEIAVAMIDDEATVKRYFRENGHIRLQPENSTMQPIIAKNVTVLGKVIANYRFY